MSRQPRSADLRTRGYLADSAVRPRPAAPPRPARAVTLCVSDPVWHAHGALPEGLSISGPEGDDLGMIRCELGQLINLMLRHTNFRAPALTRIREAI